MSVTLIVGTPGAGKSYTAVSKCVLPALDSGRPVFTNIPLNEKEITLRYPDLMDKGLVQVSTEKDPQLFINALQNIPGGFLVVLDEIWRYWDCTKKKEGGVSEDFFAMHRHKLSDSGLSQDIVILTQGTTDVPAWIRTRVDSTIIATKLTALGFASRFRLNFYTGCVSSLRPPKSKLLSEEYSFYDKKTYKYYKSHTVSEIAAGVVVNESGTMKRRTIFQGVRLVGFFIMFCIVILVLGFRFTFMSGGFMTNPESYKKPAAKKIVPKKDVALKSAATNKDVPIAKDILVDTKLTSSVSNRFWIVGSMENDNSYMIVITDGSNFLSVVAKTKDCFVNGVLFCKVGDSIFTTIPIAKTVVTSVSDRMQ